MRRLDVSIEMEGRQREVGCITGDTEFNAEFRYSEDYLDSPFARPISLSLPLRAEAYNYEQTRIFFEGLLPEGFLRRTVAENNRTDQSDYLSLLEMLGAECLGAIQIKGADYELIEPEYRPLPPDLMFRLASEGATTSADLVVESHLSLTGASGKIGAYRDEDGNWYLPVGSAPSTYIIKQSHIRYDHIVQNEQLALQTARIAGINVPESSIIEADHSALNVSAAPESIDHQDRSAEIDANPAENSSQALRPVTVSYPGRSSRPISTEIVLFATERYDRTLEGSVRTLSGLPCPLRLHQEDFGQALGIAPSNKYEKAGDQHMKKMFDLLRRYSASPIEDQMKLWDMIVFHWLIGNTDGHIKNFSLIYDRHLSSVRLAPAYDIISTIVYDTHSTDMAFSIGGEIDWRKVDRDSFVRAAEEIKLSRKIFMDRFDALAARFKPALMQAAEEMKAAGFEEAGDLASDILSRR